MTAVSGGITLPANWNLYGRTAGYSAPAPLDALPALSGIINISSGTDPVILDSFALTGSNSHNAVLAIISVNNLMLHNVNVSNTAVGGLGLFVAASSLHFSGTNNISGNGNAGSTGIAGMLVSSNSIVNFDSGTTNIIGQGDNTSNYGIYFDSSTLNFNGGNVSVITGGPHSYGINAEASSGPSYMNIASSLASGSITVNSSATGNPNYGIYTSDSFSHLQIDNTDVTSGAALTSYITFSSSSPSLGQAVSWTGNNNIALSW